jgi:hypothetical protein
MRLQLFVLIKTSKIHLCCIFEKLIVTNHQKSIYGTLAGHRNCKQMWRFWESRFAVVLCVCKHTLPPINYQLRSFYSLQYHMDFNSLRYIESIDGRRRRKIFSVDTKFMRYYYLFSTLLQPAPL